MLPALFCRCQAVFLLFAAGFSVGTTLQAFQIIYYSLIQLKNNGFKPTIPSLFIDFEYRLSKTN